MARPCPTCGLRVPSISGGGSELFPPPERLAPLAPFEDVLLNAAGEYDQITGGTDAVDFITWLMVDVRRAAERARITPRAQENTAASAKARWRKRMDEAAVR